MRWLLALLIVVGIAWWFLQSPRPKTRDPSAKLQAIRALAASEHVEIQSLEPVPRGAVMRVLWLGDLAVGGDFIQKLSDEKLIRDFDIPGAMDQGIQHDAQGRRIWYTTYHIWF